MGTAALPRCIQAIEGSVTSLDGFVWGPGGDFAELELVDNAANWEIHQCESGDSFGMNLI